MILVIDTNVLLGHAELDGRAWDEVKTAVADGILTVVIPHVVADELTARVRENRRAAKPIRPRKKELHRAPAHVADPIEAAYATADDQIEQWAASYDAAAVVAEAGFTIRAAPVARHEDLGYRAANRVRPFDGSGNGYRDTLHWYTVLELLRENPREHVVLLSGDEKAYWEGEELHPHLRAEVEPLLEAGNTFTLARVLADISIPSKYASEEARVSLTDEERDELVDELFARGPLRSHDLWNALPRLSELGEPVDAEISEPEAPTVIFAFARELVDGGTAYRTRIRLSARIVFDWVDWIVDIDDEGTREDLDITAWYVRDSIGTLNLDVDRTDVQPAPFETPPRPAASGRRRSSFTWQVFENMRLSDVQLTPGGAALTGELLRQVGHQRISGNEIIIDLLRPSRNAVAHAQGALRGATPLSPIAELAGRIARGEVPPPATTPLRQAVANAKQPPTHPAQGERERNEGRAEGQNQPSDAK